MLHAAHVARSVLLDPLQSSFEFLIRLQKLVVDEVEAEPKADTAACEEGVEALEKRCAACTRRGFRCC